MNPEESKMYNQPYFCKVDCKGLFKIKSGVITSINVIKAVDNLIGFNQKIGLVDVKIDFGFLHTQMIAKNSDSEGIPTLKSYILNLQDSEAIQPMYDMTNDDKEYLADVIVYDKQQITPIIDDEIDPRSKPQDTEIEDELEDLGGSIPVDESIPVKSDSSANPTPPDISKQLPPAIQLATEQKAIAAKAEAQKLNPKAIANAAAAKAFGNRKIGS